MYLDGEVSQATKHSGNDVLASVHFYFKPFTNTRTFCLKTIKLGENPLLALA
jgi:hypothetical protein